MNCSHCGFPLPERTDGCRHYGERVAHQESECLALLIGEINNLRATVRFATDFIREHAYKSASSQSLHALRVWEEWPEVLRAIEAGKR